MKSLGRPKEHKQTAILSVSIEADLKTQFAAIAKLEDRPVSGITEDLIQDYVQKHASGNPAFSLQKWVEEPEFVAFPTLGEAPKSETIKKMDDKMLRHLKVVAQNYALMAEKEEEIRGLM